MIFELSNRTDVNQSKIIDQIMGLVISDVFALHYSIFVKFP